MRALRPLVAIAFLLASASFALAQPSARENAAERQARWYEETLLDLARALGGAHAIRLNCNSGDYTLFQSMEQIIEMEGAGRRAALEGAWNEGFRLHHAMFPTCTADALATEATLREQGGRLADGLSATLIDPPPP
jgi:uncharacterized protein (TIGR02301 family)